MPVPTLSRNIVISVVLAILAAAALLVYTHQVQSSARSSQDATRVVVATRDIHAGTSVQAAIADGDLAYQTVRKSDLVSGAYTNLDAARGLIVTQPLFHGEQLTASRTGLLHDTSVAGRLQGNERAIRLPLDSNSGLIGDVHPGDHVDVLGSYKLDTNQVVTYVLAADVLVMDVTQPSAAQSGGSQPQGSMLLELSEHQASYVANALASADNAPQASSKTIWVALAGSHAATWKRFDPVLLPGAFPKNGVPSK